MGSYRVNSFFYLYEGNLYDVEEWDKDYVGLDWKSELIMKDVVLLPIPLRIFTYSLEKEGSGFRRKDKKEQVKKIVRQAKDFYSLVEELALHKIVSYTDLSLLMYSNFRIYQSEKDTVDNVYLNDLSDRLLNQISKREKRMETLSLLFGINDSRNNAFQIEGVGYLRVICPEFITVYKEDEDKLEILFFGKQIKDITLKLDTGLEIKGNTLNGEYIFTGESNFGSKICLLNK